MTKPLRPVWERPFRGGLLFGARRRAAELHARRSEVIAGRRGGQVTQILLPAGRRPRDQQGRFLPLMATSARPARRTEAQEPDSTIREVRGRAARGQVSPTGTGPDGSDGTGAVRRPPHRPLARNQDGGPAGGAAP